MKTLAAAGLMCATLAASAADPAPPAGTTGGVGWKASGHSFAALTKVCRPRLAAFVTSPDPDPRPAVRVGGPVPRSATVHDAFDLFAFPEHRPVRVRVTIRIDGKSPTEAWRDRLRAAFDYFDRDKDAFLNGHEVSRAFSDGGLAGMLRTGFYNPTPDRPTLDKLDADGDRRVSFEEFTAAYPKATEAVLRGAVQLTDRTVDTGLTEALFKLMDRDGDGKLTRAEVARVEEFLSSRDANEDECLTAEELLPGMGNNGFVRQSAMAAEKGRNPAGQDVVVHESTKVPPTVSQTALKRYDKNGDAELTAAECGFDQDTFRRLDADGNGRLSGEELDVWRTGPADFEVTVSIARELSACKAIITTDPKVVAARGFVPVQTESGRLSVRSGRHAVEFSAAGAVPGQRAGVGAVQNQLMSQFQSAAGAKGYVTEKDLYGSAALALQGIRVLFDDADENTDGRLTRGEFDRYFAAQQRLADAAFTATPAVRVPTLFQLMDENGDGRLSVRELRTAWDRLIVLEPPGGGVVTRQAIQPRYSFRLTRSQEQGLAIDPPNAGPRVPDRGPAWFRKMDRNGDGDVSRTEFLGARAEFAAVDTDGDGLISLAEAEAFDKKHRAASK